MDKDKGLPPAGRYSVYSPPGSSFGAKSEASGSSGFPLSARGGSPESGHFGLGTSIDSSRYSHDISRMSDNPPRSLGHRRAHSEILTLPDDISFDSDLGVVGGLDGPSFSDDTEEDLISMYLDMNKFGSSSASAYRVDEVSCSAGVSCSPPKPAAASLVGCGDSAFGVSDKPRVRHSHSQSMDGSTTINSEMLSTGSEEPSSAEAKKAMSAAKLSELALIDPKRAKRVWANRQSAARSKERKMRYIAELERKVQTLQTEATSLSAQLTLLQRDTNGLTAENSELKLRMQTTEQQVHLQDALNDALKEEIQHLKTLTCQMIPNGGVQMINLSQTFGANNQQYYSNNHPSMHTMLTAQQFQQLQINCAKQQPRPFQQQQQQQQQLRQQQFQSQQMLHQQQPQEQQTPNSNTHDLKAMNTIQSHHAQNDDSPDTMGGASSNDYNSFSS